MIWMSVVPRQWRKVELRGIGGPGGGSLAVVVNPFESALRRGNQGRLCTGKSVWSDEFLIKRQAFGSLRD